MTNVPTWDRGHLALDPDHNGNTRKGGRKARGAKATGEAGRHIRERGFDKQYSCPARTNTCCINEISYRS